MLFAGAVAVEGEGCPNAKLSIKLAHSTANTCLERRPFLPTQPDSRIASARWSVVSLCAPAATVHRRTPHTAHLTSDMPGIDRLAHARDVASTRPPESKMLGLHCRSRLTAPTELEEADTVEAQLLQSA